MRKLQQLISGFNRDFARTPRRKSPSSHSASRRALSVELLEQRTLLSTVGVAGGILHYSADPAETNDLTITQPVPSTYLVTDIVPIVAGSGCSNVNANTVICDATDVELLHVGVGDGDDHVDNRTETASVILAGDGNDVIYGGAGRDVIFGGAQNDRMEGRGGSDVLIGGDGNDALSGNAGEDIIFGDGPNGPITQVDSVAVDWRPALEPFADTGAGNDVIDGGADGDWIHAGAGNDYVEARGGDDYVNGAAGADLIFGGFGHDVVEGGGRSDILVGGSGNDRISGQLGDDLVLGDGPESFPETIPADVELRTFLTRIASLGAGRDVIVTGLGSDSVYAGRGDDYVETGAGNDYVEAGWGNDYVLLGSGYDVAFGGAGDDGIRGGDDGDVLVGGDGADAIQGNDGNDLILGDGPNNFPALVAAANADPRAILERFAGQGEGHDLIDAGAGDDRVFGGRGNDIILGKRGNDSLYGGRGRDVMIGGRGEDHLNGGSGDDLVIGGITLFDENLDALEDIRRAWSTDEDYETRIANLVAGVGPNNVALKAGETVLDDGAADVLTGGLGMDWFFKNELDDVITDPEPGEQVHLI